MLRMLMDYVDLNLGKFKIQASPLQLNCSKQHTSYIFEHSEQIALHVIVIYQAY